VQDLAVKTPWGLISAQYDLYTTGRKLMSTGSAGSSAGCGKASRSDPLAHAARKLMQRQQAGSAVPQNGAAVLGKSLPANSTIAADYDADQTKLGASMGACGPPCVGGGACLWSHCCKPPESARTDRGARLFHNCRALPACHYSSPFLPAGPTKTGAPGTFNYLIDAILAVPRTRQMYMRRLRTLMDIFVASGRLQVRGSE
jgi:hypothetical protein